MIRLAFCVVAGWVVVAGAGARVDDAAKNLIANPGFEKVEGGKAVDWATAGFAEGGKGTFGVSTDKPKSGKYCAKITGDAEWGTYVSKKIPITKGKTYVLTGYVRVAKGQGMIKFDYFKGNEYIGMTAADAADGNDWVHQTVESELSSHPEATHMTATLVGLGEYEVYFDDLVMVEK